jgi:hypothetical protein
MVSSGLQRRAIAMFCLPMAIIASATAGPTIGPPIRIDTAKGSAWANETTASAAEPFPLRIITGWNDYRDSPNIRSGFGMSFDGGQTWTDFLLRPPVGFQADVEGDPMVAHDDRTGTLWAGAISFDSNGGIYVARLDPGETEFNPPVMAVNGFVDKGWMAAGLRFGAPDSTRLYCAYNMGIIWSDDLGETWTDPIPLGSGIGFLPRVGPNGEVYVTYWNFGTGVNLWRSLDGGLNFTHHEIATRMDVWGTQDGSRAPGNFRTPSMNYLDVDPNNGTLYSVYFDTTDIDLGPPTRWNLDLYFTKSIDQGTSWTTPVVINQDASPTGDQMLPWVEVDRHGRIHIVYLDSRNVIQNDGDTPGSEGFYDVYYMYSTDGGDGWTEARLTPTTWSSDGVSFAGDYNGMAVAGDRVAPVYIQMGPGSNEDIYTNVIEFEPCPWDCGLVDSVVGINDLLALLANWGGPQCDFDGDGVGINDFLALLANWGPCP